MGYIKKKYREMLEIMDYRNYLPPKWYDFINEKAVAHNLIIKQGKECICTNCKHSFFSIKKVKEIAKCPNCKQKYEIKRSNLKNYEFEDRLILLDKIDNQFIARVFELRSEYNNDSKYYEFDRSTVEYARFIPNEYHTTFINERVSKNQGCINIYHSSWRNSTKWRLWTRYYGLCTSGLVYPHNLKELFKDTEYKYSMLWELVKHVKYVSIEDLLEMSKYSNNMEFLVKFKLYNLALAAKKFYRTSNFESSFGVSKTLYTFMRRHNITYDELERLCILKEPNIKNVRYLLKYSVDNLREIYTYVKIKDFIKYAKSKNGKFDVWIYKDYLRFANLLGFDLKNKKYAFPKNLKEEHDRLGKQVEINNKKILNQAIARRLAILNQNKYEDKNYIIYPAKNVTALENESKQQGSCVRTYSEKYATGQCDIYFLRKVESPNKSLVTVEVKNNKIVQSKAKYNRYPKTEELQILHMWEREVLSKVA